MRGPDKGPPQSLETTEFSKLVILLWRMPEGTSALTCSSMLNSSSSSITPQDLLEHGYQCQGSSNMQRQPHFLPKHKQRKRWYHLIIQWLSAWSTHPRQSWFSPAREDSALHCRGCPGQSPPSSSPWSSVACKKKKRSWPWFPLSNFV